MPTAPDIETISRQHYEQRQYLGTAGPSAQLDDAEVLERWRAQFPAWRGRYWTLRADDRGVLWLHPINLAPRRTGSPTA